MKAKVKLIIAFMSLSICFGLMSNTYSRYVAGTLSSVDVSFAKWQILVNNIDVTDKNFMDNTITFTPVVEHNDHVASGKVAPSSKGYFDIDIDPSNVDVSFKYAIDLNIEHELIDDFKATQYSFIIDEVESELHTIEDNKIEEVKSFDSEENFVFDKFIVRVYFEWIEDENSLMDDEADTAIGLLAATDGLVLDFTARVSFEQYF